MYMNLYIYSSHYGQNYTLSCTCRKLSEMLHKISHCDTVNYVIYVHSMIYYYITLCKIKPFSKYKL